MKSFVIAHEDNRECINITTTDDDGDSTFIWWDYSLTGGSLSHTNGARKFSIGEFCLVADLTKLRLDPDYSVGFYVTDKKDTVFKAITVKITPHLPAIKPLISRLSCNKFLVDLYADTTVLWHLHTNVRAELIVYNPFGSTVFSSPPSKEPFTVELKRPGKHVFRAYYLTDQCMASFHDTMISEGIGFNVRADQKWVDTPLKEWTRLNIWVDIFDSNGYKPHEIEYLWLPDSQTTHKITVYPVKSSSYPVFVKTPGCQKKDSMYVTVQITGLADLNRSPVTISPNPVSDFICITGLPESASLQITDIAGREIHSLQQNSYERVDISSLAKGVYFITVAGKDFYERVKLVKE
ncbi:MAG TPA: T9SS type A sorting domain-containing protein [Bacteroidia bacterium]|nr:T9SS type A sorting domain-containing protein [Bacteroidia bacterium]